MRVFLALLTLPWLSSGLLMLFVFQTWRGRCFVLWALLLLAWIWLLELRAAWSRPLVLVLGGVFLGLLAWAPGAKTEGSLAGRGWPLWSPLNLVPEGDWARLGVRVLYPAQRANALQPALDALYHDMESRPEYRALPHVLTYSGLDLFGRGNAAGHSFYYLPPGVERPPVLLFFHGALGNFQSYLYFWQKWAEPRGWAVVCPTFGYGNWYAKGGAEAAVKALRELPVDTDRVVVAGLSNGATAAVRLTRRVPERVHALFLVSPVLEVDQFTSSEFLQWQGRMMVAEGSEDVNVRPETVERRLDAIRKAGVEVDYRLIPGYDHHMMFTAGQKMYQLLDELL